MNKGKLLLLVFAATITTFSEAFALVGDKFISIGTGGVTGVYYPAGGAICRLVNRNRKEHGIRCAVESTGGSVYNLNGIKTSMLDMAIVQSDWEYNAYEGKGFFSEYEPIRDLRSVFALHTEAFTIIAREDSNIRTVDDLKGKKVNIGTQGSGFRATMDVLMSIKGWDKSAFTPLELKASDQAQALCDGKIDAMIYASGHPNGAVQEVTANCRAKIVAIDQATIDKLVSKYPYYAEATIPGGMYIGNQNPVKTFGVTAVLVASSKIDNETIYQVVKAVFDNFESFKKLHPVFANFTKEDMVKNTAFAPVHDGAKRYYSESKLMKSAASR